ncbi:uncharacterized protein LOC143372610 isoform X2 [Andrena cerasifolii]|uniref:uncharacterized protein LOC143372610 isoform X2 n=1 Tax=Andrena cerasifolii TaxID=2819439 RepID=UPI0040384580
MGSTETGTAVAVCFDNLVLKRLLYSLGPVRRCELLKKLKTDLQNLGLSRKQVRRGLIQLATRPLVVLTRQQTARRRYGWRRRLFLDDDEGLSQVSSNCTTDAPSLKCNSRQGNENADRSHGVEVGAAEKAEVLKAQSTAPTNDPKPTVLHPFDKALEQLDKIVSSKMNAPEKSVSKRSSVIVSADTTCKSQSKDGASNKHLPPNKKTARSERDNPPTRVGVDNNRATERSFDLVSDQIPTNSIRTLDRDKRYRIKLNLSSCFNHKIIESAKSDVNKKLDINEGASAHVEEHSPRNKIARLTRDTGGGKSSPEGVSVKGRTASSDNRVAEEDTHKRRLHGETTLDCAPKKRKNIRTSYNETKAIDRKKRKKVLKKFRTFFGDCVTVSEDEQDQDILQKQFKRRRKKDSVDSCDSGVCTAEGSAIASYVEILKDIQRAVPDSTMHEESNEAASKKTPAKPRIIDETKESTKEESIKTTDQVQDTGNGTEVDRLNITNRVTIVRSVEDVENSVDGEAVGHAQNVTAVEDTKSVARVESTQDVTENVVQSSVQNAPVVEIITEIIDLVDSPICDESTVEETIATTDVTQTFQATTKSEVDILVPKAETGMDATKISPNTSEKCNEGAEGMKSEDSSGSLKKDHVDSTDMNELLRLGFNQTCQITSNGNVLSIREHTEENTNEGVDENSNLKISAEVEVNNDEGPKEKDEASNVVEENNNVYSKDTVISSDAGEYGEAVSMNSNVGDASGSINKPVLQRSELNSTTEKKDTQANNVPQVRLRVLSSAELGSRWCPTPVTPFPNTVPPLSYANPIMSGSFLKATTVTSSIPSPAPPTQTAPAAASAVPTPLVTSSDTTANEYEDKKGAIKAILSKIHDLLLSVRTSSLPPGSHFDKLLATEFIKMKTALNVESFTPFTQNIVKLLNKHKGFDVQPLSLIEIFHYTPILKMMCARESDKYNNGAVHKPPAYAGPQNAAPAPTIQSPYPPNLTQICINISSTQPNFQENVTVQPEANIVPNNVPMPTNPATNPLLNMQQMNYRMDMQRPPPSQQAYIPRNRPVAINATQGGPFRHVLVSSAAINQPRKSPYPPNPSFINRQYLQPGFYVPPANTFYAVNTPVLNQPIQQNVNLAKISQQQYPHMVQQQNSNPPYMAQQQNFNPPHMVQQQNINPPHMVQQQNINPPHLVQQQNINPPVVFQQQNMYLAQRTQQQNINSMYMVQQQNIKPAPGMQQQTINPTHPIQQRAVNTPIGMQQQTTNRTNQQFQQTVHRKSSYNTTQGTALPKITSKLPHNTQQTVPAINYIPQSVENMYVPIAPQAVPKSVRQSEQVHQAVPTQTQMMALKNFVIEQMKASQDPQAAHSSRTTKQPVPCKNKKENVAPASLESAMKQFFFLEYLSDIQKIMLVKHIDFYFNCTAWLEHGCPGQSWDTTQSERFTLLNFQTLLKQLVDKMVNDLLQNEPCQESAEAKKLLMSIDVPRTVKIIVQDSNMVHCQVQVSKAEHVQCETVTLNECSTARQESLSAVEKQSQKKLEAADALQDTKPSDEAEETKELPKEESQKQGPSTEQLQEKKQGEKVTEVENHSEIVKIIDTPMWNDSESDKDVTEKDSEGCAPLSNIETKKNESEKPREDEVVASDLDQSNKDTKQPPNTHLVTVEISPNDDQVKVIDIDAARETRDTVIQRAAEKPEETEQKSNEEDPQPICALPSPEYSTTCEVPTVEITDSPDDDIKYSNYTHIDTSSMEASPVSFIADVRSISLEAFEKMEEGSDLPTDVAEGNIEEEEIKICLFCSKPSTVACSLCLEAKYCSKACSELHWEEHYINCKPVNKSLYF